MLSCYSYGFVTFENHEDAERIMRKEVWLLSVQQCDCADAVEMQSGMYELCWINV